MIIYFIRWSTTIQLPRQNCYFPNSKVLFLIKNIMFSRNSWDFVQDCSRSNPDKKHIWQVWRSWWAVAYLNSASRYWWHTGDTIKVAVHQALLLNSSQVSIIPLDFPLMRYDCWRSERPPVRSPKNPASPAFARGACPAPRRFKGRSSSPWDVLHPIDSKSKPTPLNFPWMR